MAIENAKILNVRIKNKYDSYENWIASNLVLEAGEIAIAHTTVDVQVDNGTAKHPALLMKVGDGEKTFANLPWMSAKAADVLSVCKNENDLKTFINGVIASAGIATDEALTALSGKVTTAEGKITTLEGKMTTAEGKISANEGAIATLNELVGNTSVNAQIKAYVDALNLGETYAAKVHGHVIADVDGLSDAIATAKKAGDDAATALGEYKTTNDAAVLANKNDISAIKDGTAIDSFADVEAALAGKQATGDYATKTEAQGYADAKDDAIAEAKKAGDDAQADVDALIAAVGTVAEGKTVVEMIADAQTAATYDDTKIKADIKANADAIELLTNGVSAEEVDGVNDLIQYVKDHGTEVTGIKKDISDNATAIGTEKTRAEGAESALSGRLDVLEAIDFADKDYADQAEADAKTYADGLNTAMNTRVEALEAIDHEHANKGLLDTYTQTEANLADAVAKKHEHANAGELAKIADGDVAKWNAAEKNAKDYADGLNTDMNARVEALEAIDHEHANADVLNGITADKVTAWDKVAEKANDKDLAAIAKTGSTDDLIQGGLVLVFDCGTSAV